jgi:hypothetical protein
VPRERFGPELPDQSPLPVRCTAQAERCIEDEEVGLAGPPQQISIDAPQYVGGCDRRRASSCLLNVGDQFIEGEGPARTLDCLYVLLEPSGRNWPSGIRGSSLRRAIPLRPRRRTPEHFMDPWSACR